MAEKDYKDLYEKSLEKNQHLKKQVTKLKEEIADMLTERLSCDVEPLKGELFGRTLSLVRIEGQLYVKAELWTTESKYDGRIIGTEEPQTHTVFFRCDSKRKPIPAWCEEMDLNFVITQNNEPQFILNPSEGHPVHLLIRGDLWAWEGWDENKVSPLQVEHDNYYLKKCAESASMYTSVEEPSDTLHN